MTTQEFSDTFSTLLNSYNTQAQFGDQSSRREIVLDEYEKSVLLTQAQDIIVKSYFDRTLNPQGQGFDDSTRRQIDFSSLIKVETVDPLTLATTGFDSRAYIATMPVPTGSTTTDVLFVLNEKLVKHSSSGTSGNIAAEYTIVPISYSEYDRQMSKPYAKPAKKQAWRIFQNPTTGFDIKSEIIPRESVTSPAHYSYKIRYVRRPRPIVLESLDGTGLTIDGVTAKTECELSPSLHVDILNKAVEIAIATRAGYTQQPVQQRRQEE